MQGGILALPNGSFSKLHKVPWAFCPYPCPCTWSLSCQAFWVSPEWATWGFLWALFLLAVNLLPPRGLLLDDTDSGLELNSRASFKKKKDFIYLFMTHTHTHTHREKEAETQAEEEAGSMQEARHRTQSRVSRIIPWAKGGVKPLDHQGCPCQMFLCNRKYIYTLSFSILP